MTLLHLPNTIQTLLLMAAKKAKTKQIESRLSIKKLTLPLKSIPLVPFLIVLLLFASFVIGYMGAEIKNLRKKSAASSVQGLSSQATTQEAKAPPKLTDSDHLRGNKEAQVILIEYSDYECPFCKKLHPSLVQLLNDYSPQVAWVYRHYPLSFHANAQKEAEASECVSELGGQDKFWLFTDKIFQKTKSNGTGFPLDQLAPLAQEIGLNRDEFQKCLASGKFAKRVSDDLAGGREAGVKGTPATFILKKDGTATLISGAQPIEQFKRSIDEALK